MSLTELYDLLPFLYHDGIEVQDIPIRLIFSALLGIAIGYNRQIRYHNAGLRTFALITVGSCVAMLCSIYIPTLFDMGDRTRIAAQVVSGVGFLGAGAIIRGRGNHIQGMTTAALIWVSAVLGLAVGAGMYISSILITGIILAILILLERVKYRLDHNGHESSLSISFREEAPDYSATKEFLTRYNAELKGYTMESNSETKIHTIALQFRVNSENTISQIQNDLKERKDVLQFKIEM